MGKKKTLLAQQVAAEHGFSIRTTANQSEVLEVLDAAGAAAATGGFKGTILRTGLNQGSNGFDSTWEARGPGGLVRALTFVVRLRADGEQTNVVTMTLQTFKFQGNGRKVTLNMGSTIRAFGDFTIRELSSTGTIVATT